ARPCPAIARTRLRPLLRGGGRTRSRSCRATTGRSWGRCNAASGSCRRSPSGPCPVFDWPWRIDGSGRDPGIEPPAALLVEQERAFRRKTERHLVAFAVARLRAGFKEPDDAEQAVGSVEHFAAHRL